MTVTTDLLARYPDYLLDEPGAPVPPPEGWTRIEYLIGAPVLALAVVGTPLYVVGHLLAAFV